MLIFLWFCYISCFLSGLKGQNDQEYRPSLIVLPLIFCKSGRSIQGDCLLEWNAFVVFRIIHCSYKLTFATASKLKFETKIIRYCTNGIKTYEFLHYLAICASYMTNMEIKKFGQKFQHQYTFFFYKHAVFQFEAGRA